MSSDTVDPRLIDLIGPGEMAGLTGSVTVEFAGRTLHVKGAVMSPPGGVLILSREAPDSVCATELISELLTAAANMTIIGSDWSKADPYATLELILGLLATQFTSLHRQHMATLAARGKPS